MAQQVKIAGALFENVPSISVPDANDVWHAFTDTSDADAAAADIASGKTAYVGGVKLVGTNPGGATVEPLSVTANGTYTAPSGTAYSPVTVNVEGGGGGGGSMSDPIRFFDYDGVLVASYSAVPSELPDVPTHEGLVDGAWNYTLAEVGEQVAAVGRCDVGANYATASGATEIDVEFVDAARLSPYLRFAPNGTVTVDWGDGSPTSTVTGTSLTTRKDIQHVYAEPGKYTIKLLPASGTTYAMYDRNSTYGLMHANSTSTNSNRIYSNCVRAARLGDGALISNSAFDNCNSIVFISIPRSVTSIGSYAFNNCFSLAPISIPKGVESIPDNAFYSCHNLASTSIPCTVTNVGSNAFSSCGFGSVTIPNSVTSIGNFSFRYCYSLASVTVPSGVTSIGSYAFQNCGGLAEILFEPTTPPTLANTNAFGGISADCIMYVPYSEDHSVLNAYKTATNWSTYASRMVEEPQS